MPLTRCCAIESLFQIASRVTGAGLLSFPAAPLTEVVASRWNSVQFSQSHWPGMQSFRRFPRYDSLKACRRPDWPP